MARPQPVKDPAAFLKDLVARKGESEHYATVFRGANLLFDPTVQRHSDTQDDSMAFLRSIMENDSEYQRTFCTLAHVDALSRTYDFPDYFGLTGVRAYIRSEANGGFFVSFVMPQIDVSKFALDVEILSHIAVKWASLARKEITELRVFIDFAFLRWEDMESELLLYPEFESN